MKSWVITAFGHENISATHKTTFQVTTEGHVSRNGHCIIGVNASASTKTIPIELKTHLQGGNPISITLHVNDLSFQGRAAGHADLTLDDPIDIVFRRSDFISERTIAISCDFASSDLPREMVEKLRDEKTELTITITQM